MAFTVDVMDAMMMIMGGGEERGYLLTVVNISRNEIRAHQSEVIQDPHISNLRKLLYFY